MERLEMRTGNLAAVGVCFAPVAQTGGIPAMYGFIRDLVMADPAYKGIRLYVERNNRSAQEVYRSMGMEDHHYRMWEWMKS
jgi:hypothetical protein